jgi:hypothetical protein
MYSDGPNKVFGSEQTIANGIVSVTVKNGAVQGQDDLSIVTSYTYVNGYGENVTITTGFSNNQQMQAGGNGGLSVTPPVNNGGGETPIIPPVTNIDYDMLESVTVYDINTPVLALAFRADAEPSKLTEVKVDGSVVDSSNYTVTEGSTIITFKESYANTLSTGNHSVEMVFTDGKATDSFQVKDNGCSHTNLADDVGSYGDVYYFGGKHAVTTFCMDCSNIIPVYIENCNVILLEIVPIEGTMKHNIVYYCPDCNTTASETLEDCTIDSNGRCSKCNACGHLNLTIFYDPVPDSSRSHAIVNHCSDCNETWANEHEPCTPDSNGFCTKCNGCTHVSTRIEYDGCPGYGEHGVSEYCDNCVNMINGYVEKYPTYFEIRNFYEIDLDFLLKNEKIEYVETLLGALDILSKTNQEIYKYTARVMLVNNLPEIAKKYLDKSKEIFYNDVELHYIYAKFYFDNRQFNKANFHIDECISFLPDYHPAIVLKKEIAKYLA